MVSVGEWEPRRSFFMGAVGYGFIQMDAEASPPESSQHVDSITGREGCPCPSALRDHMSSARYILGFLLAFVLSGWKCLKRKGVA